MMKRLLLAAVALLLALAASAQGHLSFEGMSLEGEYNTFTRIMRRNGFRFSSKDQQEPFMHGKVLGEEAEVTILVTPKTYQVYMLMVSYPQRSGWETLKNQYNSMKMKLYARYGDPQMSLEQFSSPLAENNPIAAPLSSPITTSRAGRSSCRFPRTRAYNCIIWTRRGWLWRTRSNNFLIFLKILLFFDKFFLYLLQEGPGGPSTRTQAR